jgi:hypothetical protein
MRKAWLVAILAFLVVVSVSMPIVLYSLDASQNQGHPSPENTPITSPSPTHTTEPSGPYATLYGLDPHVATVLNHNNSNQTELAAASQLFLDMGLHGNVSVLNPSDGGYVSQAITDVTVQAASNVSAAVCHGLPPLSRAAYNSLLNATQLNPEIVNFEPVIVHGANGSSSDLFKDAGKVPQLHYTLAQTLEQCPYIVGKPQSYEFVNGLHRQHTLVLDKVGLDPADHSVQATYTVPDFDYYFKTLAGKKINVNGTEVTFPLLPVMDGQQMKEQFPSKVDRQVIYADQYPIYLTFHDAKTGEYMNNPAYPWTVEKQRQALKDNLDLIFKGGDFGNTHATLFERIVKAYADPSMKSYDEFYKGQQINQLGKSDSQLARVHYDVKLEPFVYGAPEMNQTITKFIDNVDGKLAQDVNTDLGHRFIFGLALLDGAANLEPHQMATFRTPLYAKALGTASLDSATKSNTYGYWYETASVPVPKYLADQLPSGVRYAPGNMVGRFSLADSSVQTTVTLPNGDSLDI